MRSIDAPEVPAWLLNNLGCGPNNDALQGDLAESLQRGKSASWYWKQAITSIVVSVFVESRRHPLTVFRALAAGWLIYWPLGWVVFNVVYVLALVSLGLDEPDLLIGSWAPPFSWHTAHFGTTYTCAMNAIASGLLFGIGIVSGWIMAVLFRPHSRVVAVVFSCTVLLSWVVYSAGLGSEAIGARLPWSLYFWMNSVVQSVCILIGGSLAEAKRSTTI